VRFTSLLTLGSSVSSGNKKEDAGALNSTRRLSSQGFAFAANETTSDRRSHSSVSPGNWRRRAGPH